MQFQISISKLLFISGVCVLFAYSYWYERSEVQSSWSLPKGFHPLTRGDNDWINHSCLSPIPDPILGANDFSRIINMGMPKAGTRSLTKIFDKSSNFNDSASHWTCTGNKGYCGVCIKEKIIAARENNNSTSDNMQQNNIFSSCGDHKVFGQMDYVMDGTCVFPQIDYLEELYQDAPNATWILPFSNTIDWLRSVTTCKSSNKAPMASRFVDICGWEEFHLRNPKRQEDVDQFICNHVKSVRKFVKNHPSLSLVEYDIKDKNVGEILENVFPFLDGSKWDEPSKC